MTYIQVRITLERITRTAVRERTLYVVVLQSIVYLNVDNMGLVRWSIGMTMMSSVSVILGIDLQIKTL